MRDDPLAFKLANESSANDPRCVIRIEYDVESLYLTSHAGISGIPGIPVENVIQEPSAVSQRIVPDEGRSEIGSFSFRFLDLGESFTDLIREKLFNFQGLRGKTVRFYIGYRRFQIAESGGFAEGGFWGSGFGQGDDDDMVDSVFSEFQLFQTQVISDCSFQDGTYTIQCADITREQRGTIFEQKFTTLRNTVTESDTTIPVGSTVGFQPVYHGSSYSDAPNQVVGYFKLENEIIRYPFEGVTPDSFTGCTRGVLNTRPVTHVVDPLIETDRRPKIEEHIYLEVPAPKLAYMINTGIIPDSGTPMQTLPPHWHRGIDPVLVRYSDFTGIGPDLWDPALDTEGFVVRFNGMKKTDAKKFLETEIYMLCGCYSPVYSDGTIGFKRMNEVLKDAAYSMLLDERNVVSVGPLRHELTRTQNVLRVDWNWNGTDFTRKTLFADSVSILVHGAAPQRTLQFLGLHGSRHTEAIIKKRLDAFRDRYTAPPETITVTVVGSLNRLEIGDVVRLRLTNMSDFAGDPGGIDRSFEIQQKSYDYLTGDVLLELFGSTARATELAPNDTGAGNALLDAFYSTEGTDLSSVCTIVVVGGVGVIQPGTYELTNGIYYYLSDLELANGATLTVSGTVQIRVRGFFTINGLIDGAGRGKPGQPDTAEWGTSAPGIPGFLGSSRGMDGVFGVRIPLVENTAFISTLACAGTVGANSSVPYFDLVVDGLSLLGLPIDLAGTSGGSGGKLGRAAFGNINAGTVNVLGGTGADSGAGLILIGRGLAFGASGEIDLSGYSSLPTTLSANGIGINFGAYPGAGGAGCPGALLVLLDGSGISIPDLGGHFTAATGTVPVSGNPLPSRTGLTAGNKGQSGLLEPIAGYLDESMISNIDLSNVAYRIQYLPQQEVPQEDQNTKPQPPTDLFAETGNGFVDVKWTSPAAPESYDEIEIYASITNLRGDSVKIGSRRADSISHNLPNGGTRYYWVRSRRDRDGPDAFSDFEPLSATGGVIGHAASPVKFVARGTVKVNGSVVQKIGGNNLWDSDFYSTEYFDVSHVAWKVNQNDKALMVGLSLNPTGSQSYEEIGYAIFTELSGLYFIYENGVQVAALGAYEADDEFAITYDGFSGELIYYRNRIAVRTIIPSAGLQLYVDSSFYSVGGAINSVRFGPSLDLDMVSTPQLDEEAATEIFSFIEPGPISLFGPPGTSVDIFSFLDPPWSLDIPDDPSFRYILTLVCNSFSYGTGADEAGGLTLYHSDTDFPVFFGGTIDELSFEKSTTFRKQVLRGEWDPTDYLGETAYFHLGVSISADDTTDVSLIQFIIERIKR